MAYHSWMTGKRLTDQQRVLRTVTEAQWQAQVVEYAQLRGWMVAHFRPGLNQRGQWLTAVAADGAGFPDLVLARDGVVLFAELKRETGKVSDAQQAWLAQLPASFVWRPSDLDDVLEILR